MSNPEDKPIEDDAFDFSELFGEDDASPAFDGPGAENGDVSGPLTGSADNSFEDPTQFGDAPLAETAEQDAAGLFGDLNNTEETSDTEDSDSGFGEAEAAGPVVAEEPMDKKGKKKGKKEKPAKVKKEKPSKVKKEKKPKKEKSPRDPNQPKQAGNILYPLVAALLAIFLVLGGFFSFRSTATMMTQIVFCGIYVLCGGMAVLAPIMLWKAEKKGVYDVVLGVALGAISLSVILLLVCAYAYDFTIKP